MALDLNQKKAIKQLKEKEDEVLDLLRTVPNNILISSRWHDMAKNHIMLGFAAAKNCIIRYGDK